MFEDVPSLVKKYVQKHMKKSPELRALWGELDAKDKAARASRRAVANAKAAAKAAEKRR